MSSDWFPSLADISFLFSFFEENVDTPRHRLGEFVFYLAVVSFQSDADDSADKKSLSTKSTLDAKSRLLARAPLFTSMAKPSAAYLMLGGSSPRPPPPPPGL